jgi:hypothetical protein
VAHLPQAQDKTDCGPLFTVMAFSVEYVIGTQAGTGGKTWSMLERWLELLEARPAYQKALKNGAEHKYCLLVPKDE